MLCSCINVVTAYIRPKYRCLPGCLRGEKPPLATGNFSSPWVVLSSSALLLGLLLALLGLLRHMPLLAQQWGQVLAWGWFAPISASSLHYIPISQVCERYSNDVQHTSRNSQDCSVPKYKWSHQSTTKCDVGSYDKCINLVRIICSSLQLHQLLGRKRNISSSLF